MLDEGPSNEDIERFSQHETGHCPSCGEELWDDSVQCPSCETWLQHRVIRQDKTTNEFKKKFVYLVVCIIFLGFLWGVIKYL